MITCKEIEHFDNFGDSIIFWCIAGNIPKNYIKKAINLDGENYLSDCFGACVIFDSDGFHICQDKEKYELTTLITMEINIGWKRNLQMMNQKHFLKCVLNK